MITLPLSRLLRGSLLCRHGPLLQNIGASLRSLRYVHTVEPVKKRGRPKKTDAVAKIPIHTVEPVKKRGRPKKADAVEKVPKPPNEPVKKRGRPKKADAVAKVPKPPNEPVKKRGRPKKADAVEKVSKPPKPPKLPKPPKTPKNLKSPVKKRSKATTDWVVPHIMYGTGSTAARHLPAITGADLPPSELWKGYMPSSKNTAARSFIRNPDTAAMLAELFVPEGSQDKVIIDACAGPGQLTRALLNLPKKRIKKIIVLEHAESYLKFLKPLEDIDRRVKVFPWHGKDWDAYTKLRLNGSLDGVDVHDWETVHTQLQFIMHLPSSVDGEQLLSQLFRCIPDRQWLFRYGRIPMHFILPARVFERVNASESATSRCKLSIIAQICADIREAVDYEALQPYADHFYPVNVSNPDDITSTRRSGFPFTTLSAIPLAEQIISNGSLQYWDYVLRKLFVSKATPFQQLMKTNTLGPGSQNLLPRLIDPVRHPEGILDVTKESRALTLQDWAVIVDEFQKWPFKPENLGIDTFFEASNQKR